MDDDDLTIKILIGICIIAVLFETTIFAIAYFNADEIDCNFLWCSFKTSRGNSVISQECYSNGVQTNCSEMPLTKLLNNSGW